MTGTDLFCRMRAFNHDHDDRGDLMRKVWTPTPWMVDAYTGDFRDGRSDAIQRWCHDELGPECSPIHGRDGTWQRGNATIFGWTWYGFADETTMDRFLARWPRPDGVAEPERPPRRCETNLVDTNGDCAACLAIQGEACQAPRRGCPERCP